MNTNRSVLKGERGAAFLTVLLFTFLLTAIIAAVLQWSLTERNMVARTAHWLEARNAAEAVTEYGFAQIDNAFTIHATPPTFDPAGTNPLTLPPTAYWAGATDISGLVVVGGPVELIPSSGTALYYVDPNNPNNTYDPLKGQYVYRRDIEVVGTATVTPAEGGPPITAYVTESVSVRGAPLFANAIFYSSNDLEIFPGPKMDIYGPVHTNGNMFVSSQSSSLNFHGPVSITGNIFHAWSNSNSNSWGTGNETLGQDPVTFANSVATSVNLDSNGLSTGWNDSTMGASNGVAGLSSLQALITPAITASFRQTSTSTYNGNLQTGAMGVQVYNPVSFNEVIDSSGDEVNPHTMIDPPVAQVSTDAYLTPKEEVEKEKFANEAGLYVKVTVTPGTTTAAATANIAVYGAPGSAPSGTPAAQIGPNLSNPTDSTTGGLQLNLPAASASGAVPLVTFIPFVKQVTTYTAAGTGHYTKAVTYVNSAGNTISTGSFTVNGYTSSTNTVAAQTFTPSSTTVTSNPGNSTAVVNGMIDQRRLLDGSADDGPPGVDLVQVDMGAVTKAVNDMLTNSNTDTQAITQGTTSTVWTGWNGGIYVDVEQTGALAPTVATTGTAYGYTYSGQQPASVRLVDGTVASGSSLIPAQNGSVTINQLPVYPAVGGAAASSTNNPGGNGLTLATNAPVYILGNFNADGVISTSSATTPDSSATLLSGTLTTESPCCVAGDSVTVLSPGWADTASATLKPNASGSVEVATALLAGITPTSSSSNSGGAHNLIRFLENWSGIAVAVRGSLTCLYSSEIATQPYSTGSFYGAPNREWGFDSTFANGHFPPMTPKVLSFRRTAYTDMSAAQYAAALHAMWPTEY